MSNDKPKLHALVCLICLLSPAALLYRPGPVDGATALPAGAALVERVADLVESRHADARAGVQIADGLRGDLRRGVFAGVASAADLGHRIDRRLAVLSPGGEVDLLTEASPRSGRDGAEGSWVRALGMPDGVGVLVLHDLPRREAAAAPLRAALRGLQGSRALVLDLRGLDGGDPSTARHLAQHLIPDAERLEEPALDAAAPRFPDVPVFLLVDRSTAGAAEALASRLRQADRAVLVGETTAGRAWAFAELEVADGLWLRTPVARAGEPVDGTDWQGVGLFPDVRVPADRALDVARHEALRVSGCEELPPRPLGIGGSGALRLS